MPIHQRLWAPAHLEIEMTVLTVRLGAMQLVSLCSFIYMFVFSHFAYAGAAPEASSGTDFYLKGVLVSRSARSALVNDTILREGERVGNAEILAIRVGAVEVRMGSRQFTVPVGSRAAWDQTSRSMPALPVSRVAQSRSAPRYGPVKRGETLSEIAESLLPADISMNQMMVALYDANPEAFAENINVLREGAMLQIPDLDELHRVARAAATAEVVRQTNAWHEGHDQRIRLSKGPDPTIYGPVNSGETLSGIAASLARKGSTMNQMMIGLFEANPQAFDGNINVLKAGAVLRIPDEATLLRRSHETATAAVMHHMDALAPGYLQQPPGADPDDDLSAFHDERIQAPGTILLSMRNSE